MEKRERENSSDGSGDHKKEREALRWKCTIQRCITVGEFTGNADMIDTHRMA
jgi:hypothetical protein